MPTINDPLTLIGARVLPVHGGDARLTVDARSPWQQAVDDGRAYSMVIAVTPTGAADTFFYLENLSASQKPLHVVAVRGRAAAAEVIRLGTATPRSTAADAPATVTPTPINTTSSSLVGRVSALQDPDIATCPITDMTVLDELACGAAATQYQVGGPADELCVLQPNTVVAGNVLTGAIALNIRILFYLEA